MLKKSIHWIESWLFIQFHSFIQNRIVYSFISIHLIQWTLIHYWIHLHFFTMIIHFNISSFNEINRLYIHIHNHKWLSNPYMISMIKSILIQSFISITNIIDYIHSFLITLISLYIDFNTIIIHSSQTHYSFFTTKSLIWIDKKNQSRSISHK